jgi:light-regulated signal transduction histidine kinase (bacteriophytochrome)
VLNLGPIHLTLSVGAMGVLVIFLLTILLAAAVLLALIAIRRRKQAEAANRELTKEVKERKRAEEEVNQLNADLEHRVADQTAQLQDVNQQLEAFSYSIAHDLKAPLRAISGFSTMLVEDYGPKLDGEALRYVRTIESSVNAMRQLIDDLLEFSRHSTKEMVLSDIDMSEIVNSVLKELQRATPDRQIEWRLQSLPPARGDLAMMRQVWVNLLSNAIKFSGRTGKAWVEVGCSDKGERQNTYYVKDNGAGFDMKRADKMFGIFQRLHSAIEFEGTGVGLSIVQRVVQRHGGRVWAEGKVNEGATFHFTLPAESETLKAQIASSGA